MIDIEMLRNEKLIEQREEYENAFFAMEPNMDELNLTGIQFPYEIIPEEFDFEDELNEPLDYDYLDRIRDEKLIEERQIYEINYFRNFNIEIIEKDLLDHIIESYEEPDYFEFDYECYDEVYFEDDFDYCYGGYYVEQPKRPSCGDDLDYMPHDNLFDYMDCYDYPESPNENLGGIIFTF